VNSSFLLIAAQTLALGYTIVTDNEKEFAPIKDLPRENWLRTTEIRSRLLNVVGLDQHAGSPNSAHFSGR